MAPTPSSKSNPGQHTHPKTPQSKHRLHFNAAKIAHPSPNPNAVTKETPPPEHPVEVIGRIRDYPDRKEKPLSVLQANLDRHSLRLRTDIGYRDFSLDGVSLSEEEDLDGFYKKFVESRINGVKLGEKCTIMMYGPTGSGKSHTMFGCSKQPGIVYRSLKDILGEGGEENDANGTNVGLRMFVQVTVLEIYNEEIYDLLSGNNGGGFGLGWSKGCASKVKLEVMGKKAKNATFISGNEAGKISKEIQKVEKRRIVKSTLCNERSSRSHCMIILDVPMVGGRLMLVDMAGSENIEQAGQAGFEAKMQTGKINQGNIALKRVVESIANGDSHVPFRDSKLTMLLQDSFEDDKSKILMILCASPDPKEMHKTISTLEYGAKAKCIVRGHHTPTKDKISLEDSSAIVLGSRIAAMDQFIFKLQTENKLREKQCNEAHKELLKKEEEVAQLRAKIEHMGGKGSGANEEEINLKVNERTQFLKSELEKKLQECQKMANEFVELSRRRMEEKIFQQQKEVEMLRRRLEEIESELSRSRGSSGEGKGAKDVDGSSFAKRLQEIYADEDPGMVKSMDLDMGDQEIFVRDTNYINSGVCQTSNMGNQGSPSYSQLISLKQEEDHEIFAQRYTNRGGLSTVFEEEEIEEEEYTDNAVDEEVKKEVIKEKTVDNAGMVQASPGINFNMGPSASPKNFSVTPKFPSRSSEEKGLELAGENPKDAASSRRMRIQNIFTLCGNYRELSQHITTPVLTKKGSETHDFRSSPVRTVEEDSAVKVLFKENSPHKSIPVEPLASIKPENGQKLTEPQVKANKVADEIALDLKENYNHPVDENGSGLIEVYVKWEASKENPGKLITTLKVVKDASLSDLRKLIEIYLGADQQAFTFLVLGDPTGAPVPRDKEATVQANRLPICHNQLSGRLACLRPVKGIQHPKHLPLSSLENKLPLTPNSCFKQQGDCLSPKLAQNFSSTPYITVSRH
ncbi:kinesin-like protein KIN-10A [Malania oleifera]|uniref:kinesin-like protein KIN-10A n=1 Tax=Malania oleifera TaxID=397392 RepID=UPI0025AE3879|nr:kinesin-like protein KIN-10A [Malania oleifera]